MYTCCVAIFPWLFHELNFARKLLFFLVLFIHLRPAIWCDSIRTTTNKNINQNTISESPFVFAFEKRKREKRRKKTIAIPHQSESNRILTWNDIHAYIQWGDEVKIKISQHRARTHTYGACIDIEEFLVTFARTHTHYAYTYVAVESHWTELNPTEPNRTAEQNWTVLWTLYIHKQTHSVSQSSVCGNQSMSKWMLRCDNKNFNLK